jgi:hypothetical protein
VCRRASSASGHFGKVHMLVFSSQVPLAFSQSALVVGAGSCANAGAVNAVARAKTRSEARVLMVIPPKVVLVIIPANAEKRMTPGKVPNEHMAGPAGCLSGKTPMSARACACSQTNGGRDFFGFGPRVGRTSPRQSCRAARGMRGCPYRRLCNAPFRADGRSLRLAPRDRWRGSSFHPPSRYPT